ncbi:hypothetical protein EBB07_28275 [Paenibacillaceae bacterium]|nr:hypothetical protein EBB07_28275 [Paenibacillaceae bacterium]
MKLKLNVTNKSIEKYIKVCKFSAAKCDSLEEVVYKITRGVELGKTIMRFAGGFRIIRYHNVNFTLKCNEVIDINVDKKNNEVPITERLKRMHYNKHYKVMV